ncbi:hypothetical protein [uncultured Roseibium sp.]|uniref:hypothetical protein n=1 Tax=uncultured Roseibium sp. TaxID=1936171 RepID=UPI00261A9DFC|nr:hypothetical protein [uncultured Roseibium sp.]
MYLSRKAGDVDGARIAISLHSPVEAHACPRMDRARNFTKGKCPRAAGALEPEPSISVDLD